ncbi:hypothetical protein GCM10008170_12090 [Methylopila capsulata]|nr:DUF6064 family protein [Methylopila capsulata]GLK55190.1 hypothetical protein GCM10008170_12090 [Methylopila capsulata]
MSEWWTYRPSDFLLFVPRTYYRLLEHYGAGAWPWQVAALAAGLAVLVALVRGRPGALRLALALLGAGWIAVAWLFLWGRLASIAWSADYAAPAFVAQGALMIVLAALPLRAVDVSKPRRLGASALVASALAYPLLAPAMGRPWAAAEVLLLFPDPTAIATLGLLALLPAGRRAALMIAPLGWCAFQGMTLWTMGAPEAGVLLGAATVALLLPLGRTVRRRRDRAARDRPPASPGA